MSALSTPAAAGYDGTRRPTAPVAARLAHYAAITTAMEERAAEVFDGLLAAAHGGNW